MAWPVLIALLASAVETTMEERFGGAYRWEDGSFVDVQRWDELGPGRLVTFDDTGRIRALTPATDAGFTVGRALRVSSL